MEKLPQLYMRHPDLKQFCNFTVPVGFVIHTHSEGEESDWENLVERAFGMHYSFDEFIRRKGEYNPDYVLYLLKNGKKIATATSTEIAKFPGEGWVRMVGTDPEYRGIGAGRLIVTAALSSLYKRGYKSAVLSTDDKRIGAIKLYMHLGFEPIFTHKSHKMRWEKIISELK